MPQIDKSNISSEFTHQELGDAVKELKRDKFMDPAGFKREMFNRGQMLTQSLLAMANSVKNKASAPLQWNKMYIQTLEKEKWFSAEVIYLQRYFLGFYYKYYF